jgi:hypothetical protein
MTADVEALKDALVKTATTLNQAGQASALSAMATAGIVSKDDFAAIAPGVPYPNRNLQDAGTLASQTQQTMQAIYACAQALSELQQRFPSPPSTTP